MTNSNDNPQRISRRVAPRRHGARIRRGRRRRRGHASRRAAEDQPGGCEIPKHPERAAKLRRLRELPTAKRLQIRTGHDQPERLVPAVCAENISNFCGAHPARVGRETPPDAASRHVCAHFAACVFDRARPDVDGHVRAVAARHRPRIARADRASAADYFELPASALPPVRFFTGRFRTASAASRCCWRRSRCMASAV